MAGHELPAAPMPNSSRTWALFVDIDGTLLDIAATPDAVQVPAQLIPLLEKLHGRLDGALAFISGRSIAGVDALLHPLRLTGAGLHGFEYRDSEGNWRHEAIEAAAVTQLQLYAYAIAEQFPDVLIENKQFACAFHFRQSPESRVALQQRLAEISVQSGFVLQPGRDVFELRPAGIDKGSALQALLEQGPFSGRRPIFIGDDFTDEHALIAARMHGGMAIQVGDRPPDAAQYGLPDPASVLRWLTRWEAMLA